MCAQQNGGTVNCAGYPKNANEAASRYVKYSSQDPLPETAPALLNSADIKAYIKYTGMIYPFHDEDLQSASYKVRIGGKVVYWKYTDPSTEEGTNGGIHKVVKELSKDGDSFELLPNSIAFVTLEPEFRIPKYIALRFNLQITHIYKGLLLGTGPLVDPGFNGRLSIPLHNLTNNIYRFNYGDTLITMEFTKLSQNKEWDNAYRAEHSEHYKYEEIVPGRDVDDYLVKALRNDGLSSVISSIPDAIYDGRKQAREAKNDAEVAKNEAEAAKNEAEAAKNEAEAAKNAAQVAQNAVAETTTKANDANAAATDAKKAAEKAKNQSTIITIGTIIAIISTVIALMTLAFNAVSKANDRYDKINADLQDMQMNEIVDLNDEIKRLNGLIDDLEKKIEELEKANATAAGVDTDVTN